MVVFSTINRLQPSQPHSISLTKHQIHYSKDLPITKKLGRKPYAHHPAHEFAVCAEKCRGAGNLYN